MFEVLTCSTDDDDDDDMEMTSVDYWTRTHYAFDYQIRFIF